MSAVPHPAQGIAHQNQDCPPERSFAPLLTAGVPGKRFLLAGVACPLLLLSACKPVGPNYNRPGYTAPPAYKETGATSVVPPPNPQGGAWQPANPSDGMLKGKWWEIYQDPRLNQFEERVDSTNVQLRQAMETYLAAQDQVRSVRANLYPTLSAGPSISRERASANRPLASSSGSSAYGDFVIAGQASWEPDFWGRIRRSIEQAHANAQATAADAANVALTLHAEMATDYFALRGLDSQIKLLTSTVSDLQHQLDLTQRRFSGGVATAVDVAQAQTQLETVRAQLVDLGVTRAQYEHAIGTIANYNLSSFSIPPSPLDLALPNIPTGVPSQLLERRPDIAESERLAAAANAQIGIAVSAFYPTITLSGTGGFESTNPGTWIQGPSSLWSLGAQATELLFDAGQRHALTAQARHTYDAQADGYRNAVFQAFNDVEDQLSSLRILEQESNVEQRAVDAAHHSFNLSNARYKGGVTSYLEVLTAEQTLLQDQVTAIDIESRQFSASVSLVRALGGGWDVTQLP
ncbi:RND efflux system, outer membrane lipoprotein, NodT family [Candidatus Sulfotelmatomonas gaucii]|uniref:RND efflux system, outer membrane lipoprotein, NodT family n=1 Tax=Candidatus Sulfuritelmatomonas gaucii TaxID=2043161 RepID=A0A2N9M5W4_9BACT|nr:RND efflux system, outer membrane lipoprotein, NodT family [Candidatus Sulfotelmatomonas gaucii]